MVGWDNPFSTWYNIDSAVVTRLLSSHNVWTQSWWNHNILPEPAICFHIWVVHLQIIVVGSRTANKTKPNPFMWLTISQRRINLIKNLVNSMCEKGNVSYGPIKMPYVIESTNENPLSWLSLQAHMGLLLRSTCFSEASSQKVHHSTTPSSAFSSAFQTSQK